MGGYNLVDAWDVTFACDAAFACLILFKLRRFVNMYE